MRTSTRGSAAAHCPLPLRTHGGGQRGPSRGPPSDTRRTGHTAGPQSDPAVVSRLLPATARLSLPQDGRAPWTPARGMPGVWHWAPVSEQPTNRARPDPRPPRWLLACAGDVRLLFRRGTPALEADGLAPALCRSSGRCSKPERWRGHPSSMPGPRAVSPPRWCLGTSRMGMYGLPRSGLSHAWVDASFLLGQHLLISDLGCHQGWKM